jgi:hypothetical protein
VEAVPVHCGDVLGVGVAEQDVVPGAGEVRTHGSADGSGADDGELHLVPFGWVSTKRTRISTVVQSRRE